jgi:hypothetical protein
MKSLLLIVSALCCAGALMAQPGFPGESVDVIKNFDAQLLESQRIKQQPTLPVQDTVRSAQSYSLPERAAEVKYDPPRLRALPVKTEKTDTKTYNGFAKAGYGTPRSPYAEAAYTFMASENFNIFGQFKHHSARFDQDSFQRFSNTGGKLRTDVYLENGLTVGGGIGYDQRRLNYWGYDTLRGRLNEAQTLQAFKDFNYNLHTFNTKRNSSDLDYRADIDGYFLRDNYAARENGFDLRLLGRKWIADKHVARVGIRTDLTSKSDTTRASKQLNNFIITPGFDFHLSKLMFKIGANLISTNDTFSILPDIEAFVSFAPQIGLFAGWEGNVEKNTFRSMSHYNPFISPYQKPFNTHYLRYYGGIRGQLNTLSYRLQGSWGKYRDMAFYMTNPADHRNRFIATPDSATMLQISASLHGNITDDLQLTLAAQQSFIDANQLPTHYGLPTFGLNLGASYRLLELKNLHIRTDLIFQNGIPYFKDDDTPEALTGTLYDINLGVNYWITDNIGLFVEGNNLLNNTRARWVNFPQYGINVLGGITAKF